MAPQQSTPEQTHLNTLAVTNELVADEQLRVHHALAADAPVPVHGTNNMNRRQATRSGGRTGQHDQAPHAIPAARVFVLREVAIELLVPHLGCVQ